MTSLAIVSWTAGNRVSKYQDYPTETEAIAHVTRVIGRFPDAFVAPYPGSGPRDWLVDPVAKTLSVVPPAFVLIEGKVAKFDEFKVEAVVRITAQVPAWDSFENIKFLLSFSNMLNTAAMTAAQTLAKDILVYARDTVPPKLAAITTQADLDAIDPTAADPFGDGTPWPT